MGKTIALILGVVMLCGAVTACGEKDSSSSEANRNAAVTEPDTDGYHNDNDKSGNNDPDGNGIYNDNSSDSLNGVEKIITGARDAVDSVIDEGSELVDDALDKETVQTETAVKITDKNS